MKFAYKWLDLEMVILNEVTQAQDDKLCIFLLYVHASS